MPLVALTTQLDPEAMEAPFRMQDYRKFLRLAEAEQGARRFLIGIVEKQPVAAQQHDSGLGKFQRREGRIILPIVRQLHLHVIARNEGDAGWPGPVWGFGTREAHDERAAEKFIAAIPAAL